MKVLGIESSCDETAAAIVNDQGDVLSDVVHSQVEVHAPYGGVVPELASRDHLRNVMPVIRRAVADAGIELNDIDGIAVTCRPGLSGALLVGVQAALGLAWALDKPVVGVDHLLGHLLAVYLKFPGKKPASPPAFPFISLLASGGHTALYKVEGDDPTQVGELGATRDDAAGEAFDKVAKLLGLGYPGGPVIDRLAADGDPASIPLSKPMPQKDSLEFSFSGLKTNVARWVDTHGRPGDDQRLRDLCAAFQTRVVDSLVDKMIRAAQLHGVSHVSIGGGVAANSQLRSVAQHRAQANGMSLCVPAFRACTDNAAMIALVGSRRLARGEDDSDQLTMSPHTILPKTTRKGRGQR